MGPLTVKADVTVDARGVLCPVPIIWTAERMRRMGTGEVLEVLATDEAILDDLPAWCRATGHEFLGFEVKPPIYHGYTRKRIS
ncbi:MAG: sulfurtransferase TusA family protein [Chloroflexi bacterium]|nr:sulfurtransferase TusA family protein [Chloroflexota bacterium]